MELINQIAEQYVRLTLLLGQHDQDYVDAYYGPSQWQPAGEPIPLNKLKSRALQLTEQAGQIDTSTLDSDQQRRVEFLIAHLKAAATYADHLHGNKLDFISECQALYDVTPTIYDQNHFDKVLAELDHLLPGDQPLELRLGQYREQFVVPKDKLDQVFRAAIDESRKRTQDHIPLPANETFELEQVTDQIWSGYNWYKGNNYSLIQINTDHPIYIERVIDLAAHEGYPGHHVFNCLLEKHLVKDKGWMEYCIYPLFSPCSLLAEGSANYGIDVTFPMPARLDFERDVLFSLANIDPAKAERYYQILAVLQKLSHVDNMVAQRYLDGQINRAEAIALLMKYALSSEARAEQRLKFIEHNRSYVINYNVGQELVEDYLAATTKVNDPKSLWAGFAKLLSEPLTGSMMEKALV